MTIRDVECYCCHDKCHIKENVGRSREQQENGDASNIDVTIFMAMI